MSNQISKMLRYALLLASTTILLCGCQFWSKDNAPKAHDLGKNHSNTPLFAAPLQPISIAQTKVEPADLTSLRDAYAQLTPTVDDPAQQQQMKRRLANLEMLIAEEQHEQGLPSPSGHYQQAILALQAIQQDITKQKSFEASDPMGDHISYQLSRAYELQGNNQQSFTELGKLIETYPSSQYLAEAHFRQGEHLYSQGKFALAASAYEQTLAYSNSDYYPMAAYMLGWTEFKQQRYNQAVGAFDKVLTQFLGAAQPVNTELKTGQKRLIKDSIRIMSLIFADTDNEQGLLAFIQHSGDKHYHHRLFDGLAQLHLNNDRFKDSALAYLAFAEHAPTHPLSSEFYVKHIDAYILGDYPSLVMPAKQGYVEMFGVNSTIWPKQPNELRTTIRPFLQQYLTELAQYHHARAQLLNKNKQNKTAAQEAYLVAARWYQEYIDTFPDDASSLEKRFLLAESLQDGGKPQSAIAEFERYAYHTPTGDNAAEAAYAAILLYQDIVQQDSAKTMTLIEAAQNSQLRFIQSFDQDPRANNIALTLMQTSFTDKNYVKAIELANWLLARPVEKTTRLSASLVAAHSLFASDEFTKAEQAYRKVLQQVSAQDKQYADLQENLGISIYRQGEAAKANNNAPHAIALWQKVVLELPNTQVRINAQYDAASLLIVEKDWSQVIALLTDFKNVFPNHPLTESIPSKLLFAYEQSEQWALAADSLYAQWQQQPKQKASRLALWTAAEYYRKANIRSKYLPAYRHYAHSYPQPFDTAMEARFLMSEFYRESNEDSKRRFWLNKMIQADKAAGNQRTVRSKFLGAMASMQFANDAKYVYDRIKLTLPLKSSLQKKRKTMNTAINKFKLVLGYGIAEFNGEANYHIAEIFRTLSADLMDSERPKGLSALELEQYEFLLEEQAYPFEEQSIELHESNVQRSWQGNYDSWVQKSINQLSQLLPVRYRKQEKPGAFADDIL